MELDKAELRAAMRSWLKLLSTDVRQRASRAVCDLITRQRRWREASSVLLYAPRWDELDVSCLAEQARAEGRVVALPQFHSDTGQYRACRLTVSMHELRPGRFGVPEPGPGEEPVPVTRLDLILVPGLAFDMRGRRLGRGRGYYDRLLEAVSGTKCGIAFDEQLRAEIPVEAHDVLLDCMATPARWLEFRQDEHGNDLVR